MNKQIINYQQAEREGDFAKASEIKYGKLVKLETGTCKRTRKIKKFKNTFNKEEVDEA